MAESAEISITSYYSLPECKIDCQTLITPDCVTPKQSPLKLAQIIEQLLIFTCTLTNVKLSFIRILETGSWIPPSAHIQTL